MYSLLNLLSDCTPKEISFIIDKLVISINQLEQFLIQLNQQGIEIKKTENTLQLIPQTMLINMENLQKKVNSKIYYRPIINSTNQFLIDNIKKLNKGDICLAEYQSEGRGRRGRHWQSPFASQLIMSFYWTINPQKSFDGLSIVIAMAIYDTFNSLIEKNNQNKLNLKWPNDIYINGRKLAGILIEMVNHKNALINLIIGIGINLKLPKQTEIDQPWAELDEIIPNPDRNKIIPLLISNLYHYLQQFEQNGIDENIRYQWQLRDQFFNQEVNIIRQNDIISGIEQGINKNGHLKLLVGNEILTFNAGDVSLRKKL